MRGSIEEEDVRVGGDGLLAGEDEDIATVGSFLVFNAECIVVGRRGFAGRGGNGSAALRGELGGLMIDCGWGWLVSYLKLSRRIMTWLVCDLGWREGKQRKRERVKGHG